MKMTKENDESKDEIVLMMSMDGHVHATAGHSNVHYYNPS